MDTKGRKKISVVIPAYNEGEHIRACLQATAQVFTGMDYEIIVVDDGSQDQTATLAREVAQANPYVAVYSLEANRGKGAALIFGCQHASGDLVAFLDADLELHPGLLLKFQESMKKTGADVIVGSKGHPESRLVYPFLRRITSAGYSVLIRLLFGLHVQDTQTGIKLFRAEVLKRVIPKLRVERYAFDLELLVATSRFGYKILEAPVEVQFHRPKGGRIGLLSMAGMFFDTLRIFYWSSFWKWLDPSLRMRFWMVAFVLGLIVASFGFAHWLAIYLDVPQWLSRAAYVVTLRFLDTRVRDWILVFLGLGVVILALVELNKGILAAFARADRGGLAGISRGEQPENLAEGEAEEDSTGR